MIITIGQYNVENLFDTIDDPNKDDNEFLPNAEKKWNTDKYQAKIKNIAKVIKDAKFDIFTICEIENNNVLNDLCSAKGLKTAGYKYAWIEGPDQRSIDVGVLYKQKVFKPYQIKGTQISDTLKTRLILTVSGVINKKDTLHVIANHWPSRLGGQEASNPKRALAADKCAEIINEIQAKHPNHAIVVAGDMNDEPNDASIVKHLMKADLVNATLDQPIANYGTINYKNQWDMIDQILVSSAMTNGKNNLQYVPKSFKIVTFPYMKETEEKYKDQPLRTFAGKRYLGGYSDHFPVSISIMVK